MSWNPLVAKIANLRDAARLLPKAPGAAGEPYAISNASHYYALINATHKDALEAGTPRPTLEQLEVRSLTYALAVSEFSDAGKGQIATNMLKLGYYLNHPQRLLNPDTSKLKITKLPAASSLVKILSGSGLTACPRNTRGTSCFVDTVLVIMFMATNAYDGAIHTKGPAARYRNKYSAGFDEDNEIIKIVRAIGENIRLADRNVAETVQTKVNELRDALRPVLEVYDPAGAADIVNGHEDLILVYNLILKACGWTHTFAGLFVDDAVVTRSQNVPVPLPSLIRYNVESQIDTLGPSTAVLKLTNLPSMSEGESAGGVVGLQDAIDAMLDSVVQDSGWEEKLSIVYEPQSGVIVFGLAQFRVEYSLKVSLPRNRIVNVEVGLPHSRRRVTYKVFAVAIHEGITEGRTGRGHYLCYFWRDDVMFRYDDYDTAASVLSLVPEPGADADADADADAGSSSWGEFDYDYDSDAISPKRVFDTDAAFKDIRKRGVYYFAQRTDDNAVGSEAVDGDVDVDLKNAEDWAVWAQIAGVDNDVIAKLEHALPNPGSSISVPAWARWDSGEAATYDDVSRKDIASVFPTQFMTDNILDIYGREAAAKFGAVYVPTGDLQRLMTTAKFDDELHGKLKRALKRRKTVFIPMMNFRRGSENSPLGWGDHWSLLVFHHPIQVGGGGKVEVVHFNSKMDASGNDLNAFQLIDRLTISKTLPADTSIISGTKGVKQPDNAPPEDPAAAACGPIVLKNITAWFTYNYGTTAIQVDAEMRIYILDDLRTKMSLDESSMSLTKDIKLKVLASRKNAVLKLLAELKTNAYYMYSASMLRF